MKNILDFIEKIFAPVCDFIFDELGVFVYTDERVILGSGFGLGLIPFAPGTFGTLIGIIIHWMNWYCIKVKYQTYSLIILLLITCIICLLTSDYCSMYWESNDPKQFIIDEIAGYLLTALIIGNSFDIYEASIWKKITVIFVLFRFCDIIKLPGAKYIDENIHNKWGILLDDLVSAIYAGGSVRLLLMFNYFK